MLVRLPVCCKMQGCYQDLNQCTGSLGFPSGSVVKSPPGKVGAMRLIPGMGRFPGEGNGYPLQYSGPENSMGCIIHGVTKRHDWVTFTSQDKVKLVKLTVTSGWLCSFKKKICIQRHRHTQGEDSHVKTEVEIGVLLPEAKECLRPPEPARGKEGVFKTFAKDRSQSTPSLQTYRFKNCERINLCCCKPPSLW